MFDINTSSIPSLNLIELGGSAGIGTAATGVLTLRPPAYSFAESALPAKQRIRLLAVNVVKLRESTNLVFPKSLVAPSKSPPVGETLASLFFKSSLPGRIIHSCLFLIGVHEGRAV